MLRWLHVSVKCILVVWIPIKARAVDHNTACYTLRKVNVEATAAIEAMSVVASPYLRLVKWFCPTTAVAMIYRELPFKPGAVFTAKDILCIKKRLTDLPYFSAVAVTVQSVDTTAKAAIADISIQTKDRFPVKVGIELEEGPLFTLIHNNAWGYGHKLTNQIFLKKRWGYGLDYELPTLRGSYLVGGQWYRQAAEMYTFDLKNIWFGKSFVLPRVKGIQSTYWIAAISGYRKRFTKWPVAISAGSLYANCNLVLVKFGLVSDSYTKSKRGVFTLHQWEHLPKGGSVEVVCGYKQETENKNNSRHCHYVAISCIKNVVHASCKYLHLAFAAASFLHKSRWEEAVLKGSIAYALPTLCTENNGIAFFVGMDCIAGFRLPTTKRLAISYRDPEALESPDEADLGGIETPICARLNLALESRLHRPLVYKFVRFAFLGFARFIALYDRDYVLLNTTLVKDYGIGLQVEHVTRAWPAVACKIAYSPLCNCLVPSVGISICGFKNAQVSKPMLMAYS